MRRTGIVVAVLALAAPSVAEAGGFYVTDRGTRPLGRGFAFVAGADDAGALWYNPAGISYAGHQAFIDATITLFDADFTRIDGGGNVLPTVETTPPPLPIPMLAYTHPIDDVTIGAGLLVPNVVPFEWPSEIVVDGQPEPAPQRYSLIDMHGSAFAHVVVAGAWRPTPELSIGAGVHLIVGRLVALKTLSACDRVICTQPESPDYDSLAQIEVPIFSPTAQIGATYDAGPVRLGLSFMLPHSLGGDGTVRERLPSAAIFDGARIEGDAAHVDLDMPWVLRGGVELRAIEGLRAELAIVYEAWSVQEEMSIEPEDIWIRDVNAIGDYQVGPIHIPRQMNDVVSVRLGGEYDALMEDRLTVRAGVNFENSAFDDAYLTPLTLDSTKLIVGLGASYEVSDGVFVDASYGHVFLADREVRDSRVPQENPIRPPPQEGEPAPDGPVYVGNGDYSMEANVFGLGLRWVIDASPVAAAADAATDRGPRITDDGSREPDPGTQPAETMTETETETEEEVETLPWGSEDSTPWYQRGRP